MQGTQVGDETMGAAKRLWLVVAAVVVLGSLPAGVQGSLVAYWPFDNNANDLTGNGNNATLYNGATYDPSGYFGQALSLDGTNDYAMALDSPTLRVGSYTVSAWVRPVNTGDDFWTGIVGKPGRNFNMWLGEANDANGGYIHHRWHDAGGTNSGIDRTDNVPMAPAWTHIVITNDGTTGRTYINGVPLGSAGVNGALIVDNTNVFFGTTLDGAANGAWLRGSIDDVAIWNQALPPATILGLANATVRPADFLNLPHARLVGGTVGDIIGAAYAQNIGSGQIAGPVTWQIHTMNVTTGTATAYVVAAGQDGNQNNHTGSLGMDFNVASAVTVTQLGVFDDDSNGLSNTITARLYDRTAPGSPLATLTFSPGDPGVLAGGSRFKTLATPLVLPVGFQGRMVAEGYGGVEENGNGMGSPVLWTTDSGGGTLSFVGTAYYGNPGTYPTNVDGGPVNRYAAGTFVYDFQTYTVGDLIAQGSYNVGDDLNNDLLWYLGNMPGEHYLRLSVQYSGLEDIAYAWVTGVPEPATLLLLGGGLLALARRRRRFQPKSIGSFQRPALQQGGRSMVRFRSQVGAAVLAGIVLAASGVGHAGLISYWPLNDAAGSSSAANLVPLAPVANLRNMNTSTSWVPGRFGGALDFTVADDYLDVVQNVPETNVTVSMWIRTTQQNVGFYSVNNPERGGENDRNQWLSGGNINGRIWSEQTITTSGTNFADGLWHHVVHQYGAAIGGQRVYVDGALRASGNLATSNFNWQTHLTIGWANQNGSFNGQIDDVAIWDNVLSEGQIQALANGTASPGDTLNVPHARLVGGTVGDIIGAAYAQNAVSGQIAGPVTWQIHKMNVITGTATAYVVPAWQDGNQQHTGPLGHDFNVNQAITITHLGVFDDDSNGLSNTLSARLYDRTAPGSPLATLTFSPGDPGVLIGGSRFKTLATPLILPAGFQGRMVADGYGGSEENGNNISPLPWTTDSGGGTLSFVGVSYWGPTAGTYPTNADGGPVNRYAAGTFLYDYQSYTVGELIGEGNYNVGDDLNNALLWYLGNMPGDHYLRLSVQYGGAEDLAYAWVTGVPEPATCLLLAGGLLALVRRRRKA